MRTTLNIEDDVLLVVRAIARQQGHSLGRTLSDLARQALSQGPTTSGVRGGVPLFPVRPDAGPVTLDAVNRLRDEAP
jgi:hypothetical protein